MHVSNMTNKRPADDVPLNLKPLKKQKVEQIEAPKLPEEIIISIFYQLLSIHVSADSLPLLTKVRDLSLVSKSWKEGVDKMQIEALISFGSIQSILKINPLSFPKLYVSDEKVLNEFIKRNGSLVKQLAFNGQKITIQNDLALPIIQSCQNIEILDLSSTLVDITKLTEWHKKHKFTKVHTLVLPHRGKLNYSSLAFLGQCFNNVKNLALNSSFVKGGGLVFFDVLKSYFFKVEAIDLGDIRTDKEDNNQGWTDYNNVVVPAHNEWIQENSHVLEKIKIFKTGNGTYLNDDSFKHILKNFPNLECLEVSPCCIFRFEDLIKSQTDENGVCKPFLSLKEFVFGNQEITVDGMRQLVTVCPNLRRIYIASDSRHQRKYHNSEVLEVFASLQNLKYLRLDGYGNFYFKELTFIPEKKYGFKISGEWDEIEYSSKELEDLVTLINDKFNLKFKIRLK